MRDEELPDWAKTMSDAEWKKLGNQYPGSYTRCSKCGKRLILTLCKHGEKEYFCTDHCPEHRWQSDYDWQTECARCGISYTGYLWNLLKQHNISFSKP